MMRTRTGIVFGGSALALGLLTVSPAGCAWDMRVGDEGNGASTIFDPPDAAGDGPPRAFTTYCASNKCPTGYTTCSTSKFLCDVDLRSDPKNCGECGAACPERTPSEDFACVEGRCVMQCNERARYADCDGLVDNGCEVELGTDPRHCRTCGDVCEDGVPCVARGATITCGCPPGASFCPGTEPPYPLCTRLASDDANCGHCNVQCSPTGGTLAPPPPNTYYGCVDGECGRLRCAKGWDDCNGDLDRSGSDGCEVQLETHENCRECGDNCLDKGMHCVKDPLFAPTACKCPAGQNFCGISFTNPYFGMCADFSSDWLNCGGCGNQCPGITRRSRGICVSGTCKLECVGRWADCNGNTDDDCEVDVFSDPQNCGGCGITCDTASGQACAGGRCVVEPCREGERPR